MLLVNTIYEPENNNNLKEHLFSRFVTHYIWQGSETVDFIEMYIDDDDFDDDIDDDDFELDTCWENIHSIIIRYQRIQNIG